MTGDSLNKKKISDIVEKKLYGGALIIEKSVPKMNEKTVARLNKAMEQDTGEMLIRLGRAEKSPLDRLLSSNREFRKKIHIKTGSADFSSTMSLLRSVRRMRKKTDITLTRWEFLRCIVKIDSLQREDHFVDGCGSERSYG